MNPKFYWTLLVAIFVGGVLGGQMSTTASTPAATQLLTSTSADE
ncbi:MAG: hypothetical protein ABJ084_09365 [Halioglobus sp.]